MDPLQRAARRLDPVDKRHCPQRFPLVVDGVGISDQARLAENHIQRRPKRHLFAADRDGRIVFGLTAKVAKVDNRVAGLAGEFFQHFQHRLFLNVQRHSTGIHSLLCRLRLQPGPHLAD